MLRQLRWKTAQFFEIRWWKRYLGNKDKTAYLNWKKAYWRDFLEKSGIEPQPGMRVLDAGCGPAGIFTIFPDQITDAVDPLLDQYERELPHFTPSDWPAVRFHRQPLETYHSDAPYPLVFCLNAINHVEDLPLCLSRLSELTGQGGTLALSIDAHNYGWLKRIFRLQPADILHPHQYDLEEYAQMLTANGFVIQRTVLIKKEWIFNYYLLVAEKNQ